jgi:serine/threonine-protein kinase
MLAEPAARTVLTNAGLKLQVNATASATVPAGDVISQDPSPGSIVQIGSIVELEVSTGPPKPPQT